MDEDILEILSEAKEKKEQWKREALFPDVESVSEAATKEGEITLISPSPAEYEEFKEFGESEKEKEKKPIEKRRTDGLTVHYHLSEAQAWEALMYVDRKHSLVKRCVFSAVLVILALYFVINSLVSDVESQRHLVIGLICLGFAIFYWAIFYVENRKRAKAIGMATDEFVITFYPEAIGIGEYPDESIFRYDNRFSAEEQRDFFLISDGDNWLYCLEKYWIEPEKIEEIRAILREALQKKFVQKRDAEEAPEPMTAKKENF